MNQPTNKVTFKDYDIINNRAVYGENPSDNAFLSKEAYLACESLDGFQSIAFFNNYLNNSSLNTLTWVMRFAVVNNFLGRFNSIIIRNKNKFFIKPENLADIIKKTKDQLQLIYPAYKIEIGTNIDGYESFYLNNMLIGWVEVKHKIESNEFLNIVEINGLEYLCNKFLEYANQYKFDDRVDQKTNLVVELRGWSVEGSPIFKEKNVLARKYIPEYYPYIEGGAVEMFGDFLNSEENVILFYGLPGTGKTSLVSLAAQHYNLKIITANSRSVITDPRLFKTIFEKLEENNDESRGHSMELGSEKLNGDYIDYIKDIDNLSELKTLDVRGYKDKYPYIYQHYKSKVKDRISNNIEKRSIILIEDADILLKSRKEGNSAMQELLNDTDGISSNSSRKIIFTTNQSNLNEIDFGLTRNGRCFGFFDMQRLTPSEATIAREKAGLPPISGGFTKDVVLADALAVFKKQYIKKSTNKNIGFI